MQSPKFYHWLVASLFIIPLIITSVKLMNQWTTSADILPKDVYDITYEFDIINAPDRAKVEIYLPTSSARQMITELPYDSTKVAFSKVEKEEGIKGIWEINNEPEITFQYNFEYQGKAIRYDLPEGIMIKNKYTNPASEYLQSEDHIQSDNEAIIVLADSLKKLSVSKTLESNFDYIQNLENTNTGILTDALTALRRGKASCNGKSRLFVALCRAQGIPARVVGGIILESKIKRTSHLWTEVYVLGNWIPFDVLNGHFAYLPAHYMELYKGDHFLVTRTKKMDFDYQFDIKKKYQTSAVMTAAGPQLWFLISSLDIPMRQLRGLLLLPLVAVMIAIGRNVIGLKTIGIFLPALIGLSFLQVSAISGLATIIVTILFISLLHYILSKLGLLHVPKVVFMLTAVVMIMIMLSALGNYFNIDFISSSLFIPVVILSITAERFAKILLDDSFGEAMKILLTTLGLALVSIPIFRSDLLVGIFLSYPEHYFTILGMMLLLGRWIGMRVIEYSRFEQLSL